MGHREILFYWKWDIITSAVINAASLIERLSTEKYIHPIFLSKVRPRLGGLFVFYLPVFNQTK